ncbi:hypothetical protein HDV04_004072 [Boothiomyces sp. JEL0838]|nr:hypothetical protein HDV04_004072 [Boothiomyces sp. JEL0838]
MDNPTIASVVVISFTFILLVFQAGYYAKSTLELRIAPVLLFIQLVLCATRAITLLIELLIPGINCVVLGVLGMEVYAIWITALDMVLLLRAYTFIQFTVSNSLVWGYTIICSLQIALSFSIQTFVASTAYNLPFDLPYCTIVANFNPQTYTLINRCVLYGFFAYPFLAKAYHAYFKQPKKSDSRMWVQLGIYNSVFTLLIISIELIAAVVGNISWLVKWLNLFFGCVNFIEANLVLLILDSTKKRIKKNLVATNTMNVSEIHKTKRNGINIDAASLYDSSNGESVGQFIEMDSVTLTSVSVIAITFILLVGEAGYLSRDLLSVRIAPIFLFAQLTLCATRAFTLLVELLIPGLYVASTAYNLPFQMPYCIIVANFSPQTFTLINRCVLYVLYAYPFIAKAYLSIKDKSLDNSTGTDSKIWVRLGINNCVFTLAIIMIELVAAVVGNIQSLVDWLTLFFACVNFVEANILLLIVDNTKKQIQSNSNSSKGGTDQKGRATTELMTEKQKTPLLSPNQSKYVVGAPAAIEFRKEIAEDPLY